MKEINKALKTYIRDVCNQALPERPSDVPNLKAIAEKASEADTIQVSSVGDPSGNLFTLTLAAASKTCSLRGHLLPQE